MDRSGSQLMRKVWPGACGLYRMYRPRRGWSDGTGGIRATSIRSRQKFLLVRRSWFEGQKKSQIILPLPGLTCLRCIDMRP